MVWNFLFWSENVNPKEFSSRKDFRATKSWVQKIVGPKYILIPKIAYILYSLVQP